jgi:hypothetical protein
VAPRPWVAAALATSFLLVLFKIGNDADYEFINFPF